MNKEIVWHSVNSLLAGGLVFLGAMSTGKIDFETIVLAFVAAGIVCLSQFKDFWTAEKPEYSPKLFKFI